MADSNLLNNYDFSMFSGKSICLSGKNFSMIPLKDLKAKLTAAGAQLSTSPTAKTDIMVSGTSWSKQVRDAVKKGVKVWSLGQLIMESEGRHGFPSGLEIPSGSILKKKVKGALRSTTFNLPDGLSGELVLKWKRVDFNVHPRVGELLSVTTDKIDYQKQCWGNFFYNGEPLSLASLSDKGGEEWALYRTWENGSEIDDGLVIKGEGEGDKIGFNCTFLTCCRHNKNTEEVTWIKKDNSVFMAEIPFSYKNHFGDVQSINIIHKIFIDIENKKYSRVTETGHYVVNPEDPHYL